jgi:hypothetical protein
MKAPTLMAVVRHRGTEFSNPFPSSGQSVSRGIFPSYVEKPGFSRGCAGRSRRAVGRDGRGAVISRRRAAISLSGQIPVPQRR